MTDDTFKLPEVLDNPDLLKQQRAEDLFGEFQTITTVPTAVPVGTINQIQYKSGGPLYFYDTVGKVWVPITFDLLAQFIDLVSWNSVDGYTQSGTGVATAQGGFLYIGTASGLAGSQHYIYGTGKYTNLLETGKLVTVEWQIANISPGLGGGGEYHFYMENGSTVPPGIVDHFGFYTSGDVFFASNADATTQKTTTTGVALTSGDQRTKLKIVVNPGTDIKFYINNVLVMTHTVNLPALGSYRFVMGLKTGNTTARDISLNRVIVQKEY